MGERKFAGGKIRNTFQFYQKYLIHYALLVCINYLYSFSIHQNLEFLWDVSKFENERKDKLLISQFIEIRNKVIMIYVQT